MKGLLRENFYAACMNEKVFMMLLFITGIVVVILNPDSSIYISYMLCCLIGSAFIALEGLSKDNSCNWERYRLTLPVTRAAIVKSRYAGQLSWIFAGVLPAGAVMGISRLLHGYLFDRRIDGLLIYILGISIGLFMSAIFFPLLYLCGEERRGASLVISTVFAVGIVAGLIMLVNFLLGPDMPTVKVILGGAAIVGCAAVAYGASYLLAVGIFRQKEY